MKPRKSSNPHLSLYQSKLAIRLTEEDIAVMARESMAGFTLWTKPDYETNWHHEIMCQKLDDFAAGRIKRLMIFMPPRHGKSELVSRRLPAFIFGQQPNKKIVSASYADSLASSMNRDVQRIMESSEYKFLFPQSRLGSEDSSTTGAVRNTSMFEIPGKGGIYKSVGLGSGLTGHGADVLLIDDPIKDQQEADSFVYRERAWNWYQSTAYTRLEKNGQVLITMTRWHEDDLAGRLLKQAKGDPNADQWEIIDFPALREDMLNPLDPREIGEPLWPEKYSKERLTAMKKAVGSRVWNSLYQQKPTEQKGALIKRDQFKFYRSLPADALKYGDWLASWDMAFKETKKSDYVVGQIWVKFEARKYLVDQVRDRMDFNKTIDAVKSLTGKHPHVYKKLVENKANGPAVISALSAKIEGLIGVEANDSKVARVNAVSPEFEAGDVWFPDPLYNPWVHDYIEELVTFPNGANDDQVDATTQALLEYRSKESDDFSEDMVPKSKATIAGQGSRGRKW